MTIGWMKGLVAIPNQAFRQTQTSQHPQKRRQLVKWRGILGRKQDPSIISSRLQHHLGQLCDAPQSKR